MDNSISNIQKNIFKISDSMILAGEIIKKYYSKESDNRSDLFKKATSEVENLMIKELKKISNVRINVDFENFDISNSSLDSWIVDGISNYTAFKDKKGKFSFDIILIRNEMKYDESNNLHLFKMKYFPIQDEIFYSLNNIGRFKIEKASSSMKKIVKLNKKHD